MGVQKLFDFPAKKKVTKKSKSEQENTYYDCEYQEAQECQLKQ
jgi:hypothetical protein